jgi:hypothetical protein
MIQSGDGDWIINRIPPGIESQVPKDAMIQHRIGVLNGQRAFYLSRRLPGANKKSLPGVLGGEIPILDKNHMESETV